MLRDIIHNFTPLNGNLERLSLLCQSALNAYKYPTQAQHLSYLGELSGYYCIKDMHARMAAHPTGKRILQDKPRVTPESFNISELLKLDDNTFGYHYGKFMADRQFSSADRPLVKYIPDLELAYVYQRYKEIHDFIHVLLMFDVAVYDEIVVKWFEMAQLGLPSTTLSAFVGASKLSCEDQRRLVAELPRMLRLAKSSEFLMNIYFEEHISDDLQQFRKELRLL